ncbi:TonB-dependent receptor plug domain-containing protein [Galbibacter sp. BG1]|uniref:TonB-dependent receptor plug domain-containing protein n=1 Tax=Galbibacter sp. BG1 TaxID=1170699 RepID=UPI00293BD02C|nr:TonB-dependent receptor plug domain-containing protein [Galbibacter sp. BG1]
MKKKVGGASTIDVVLEQDSQALEEVIVVGYGTSTKESFTGTATKVDSESIEKKSVSNISQALAGEAAGVRVINTSGQPDSAATVRIRGFGSVNGNRDPLYIVDGVPFVGNISAINPADIKSTTILKDASATAIYGSRGANGVVVITTKNGKGQESYIEVETKTGQNMSLIPRSNTISSPEQYIGLSWEGLYNKGVIRGVSDPTAYANQNLFSGSGIDPKYNMWNVADGGELINPSTGQVREGVTRKYNPENWEDYAFQPANRLEANLKIGGGNEKTSYFTSFGYLKDNGYTINSDYERISTRLNLRHEVKDWLEGSVNIGYTISDANNNGQSEDSGSVFWFVDNIPSIYPLFLRDNNGNIV